MPTQFIDKAASAADYSSGDAASIGVETSNHTLQFNSNGTKRTVVTTDQTQTLTNKTLTSPTITGPIFSGTFEIADDAKLTLGDDNDQAAINRSATLNAATALTGVVVGTPVTAAIPANSLILSNITADGDQVLMGQTGGNSQEWLRYDASAKLVVVNEAAGDVDTRIEGDNNANMIVVDGGTDSIGLGAAVVAGAFCAVSGNAVNRDGVTSVGRGLHQPALTFTQTNADPTTLAVTARDFIGIPTFAGSAANQTLTDASTLYIAGAPAAGTNVTITNVPQALTVAAGKVGITPTFTVASASGADLKGISVPATTLTLTGTTQVTAAQGAVHIAQPTLTDSSAVTVDTYASLYIANAPAQAGMVTLTAPYALWVDAGTTRLDGTTLILGGISYTVPPDDGDAGEQLQTNGSGVLTWESAASTRAVKNLLGRLDPQEALQRILSAPIHRFTYKADAAHVGGDYETEFAGIVADEAPWAMKHQGRIFNPISAAGHAFAAIQALAAEVADLKAQLATA